MVAAAVVTLFCSGGIVFDGLFGDLLEVRDEMLSTNTSLSLYLNRFYEEIPANMEEFLDLGIFVPSRIKSTILY